MAKEFEFQLQIDGLFEARNKEQAQERADLIVNAISMALNIKGKWATRASIHVAHLAELE